MNETALRTPQSELRTPSAPQPIRKDGALWLTFDELAAALGTSYHNIAAKAARGTYRTHFFPSEKHQGKTVQRVAAHDLPPALQREINAWLSRFASVSPDACLLEIEATHGIEAMETARGRYQLVQQYRAVEPKTQVSEVTGRRIDSAAVRALCESRGVAHRTLRRWAQAFDQAAGSGNRADDLHRAFVALLPGRPGRADAEKAHNGQDRRFRVTLYDRLAIQGIWMEGEDLRRPKLSIDDVWDRVVASCPRCKHAPMAPVDGGWRGRYKQHTCPACQFTLSYSTVRRIIKDTPPAPACLARQGPKVYDDRFAMYALRDWSGIGRSAMIFGDHHELDRICYDPDRLTNADGSIRYTTVWLSAWACVATGAVGYAFGEQPNGQLAGLAFRDYVRKFGVPDCAWSDNGLDYLGKRMTQTMADLHVAYHQTLASDRLGASHAKSKPVERLFREVEEDCVQKLVGWRGKDVAERKEMQDVEYRLKRQHEQWVRTRQGSSPLATTQEVAAAVARWIDNVYHKLPTAKCDRPPLDAFDADPRQLTRVSDRVLDLLLMERGRRKIGRNGVSIERHWYWSPELFGYEGRRVQVFLDPRDASKIVVLLLRRTDDGHWVTEGKPILAYAKELRGLNRADVHREGQLKHAQRRMVEDAIRIRQAAAAGYTALDQVREERGIEPPTNDAPARRVANAIPMITPMHKIASQLSQPAGSDWRGRPNPVPPCADNHAPAPNIGTMGPVIVPPDDERASREPRAAVAEWDFQEENDENTPPGDDPGR